MATADFERPRPGLASPLFGDNKAAINSMPPASSSNEPSGVAYLVQRRWQRELARRRTKEVSGASPRNNSGQPLSNAPKPVFLTAREIGGTATEALLKRIRQLNNELARKRREYGGNNTYMFLRGTVAERAELAALNSQCGKYQSRFAKDFETQAGRIRREKERRRNGKTK